MKILLVHPNFPAQFKFLAQILGANPDHEVCFLTKNPNGELPGVKKILYKAKKRAATVSRPSLVEFEKSLDEAEGAYEACAKAKTQGFKPDVIFGYSGWGSMFFLKDLYPNTPLGVNLEWYYRSVNSDADFFKDLKLPEDFAQDVRIKNSIIFTDLANSDAGITATHFQKAQLPKHFKSHFTVAHEGIDVNFFKPADDDNLVFEASGVKLTKADEVVSFATRGMEPYRGFPQFIEALSMLQKERPKLQAVIAGKDRTFYGSRLSYGKTFKDQCLEDFSLDLSRVHFVDFLDLYNYRKLLQITKAHVYLTCPFVLSWSMLEAMACETPMVCSNTAPVQEVITNEHNGILTDFFDTSQLVSKLTDLLNNGNEYLSIQKAARKTIIENYELRSCLQARLVWLSNLAQLKDLNP